MKYKIVKHYNKENGHFTGYELMRKWFFLFPWKSICRYGNDQHSIEHDLVWLASLDGMVKYGDCYD